jgi:hypothetical protein
MVNPWPVPLVPEPAEEPDTEPLPDPTPTEPLPDLPDDDSAGSRDRSSRLSMGLGAARPGVTPLRVGPEGLPAGSPAGDSRASTESIPCFAATVTAGKGTARCAFADRSACRRARARIGRKIAVHDLSREHGGHPPPPSSSKLGHVPPGQRRSAPRSPREIQGLDLRHRPLRLRLPLDSAEVHPDRHHIKRPSGPRCSTNSAGCNRAPRQRRARAYIGVRSLAARLRARAGCPTTSSEARGRRSGTSVRSQGSESATPEGS